MFEITGDDVAALNDVDLRTLVARLSLAELSRRGLSLSGVTAGGNQDAADGGIDVRVEVAGALPGPDFVPRGTTGFQAKKTDMKPAAIKIEMKPKGVLRPVIGELADAGGSYIIVSSKGSVADKQLIARRKAMRAAVAGHPRADDLHVDFYDRERVATWINEYPGVAAWVRVRVGRGLSGWRAIGVWTYEAVTDGKPYLCDDTACLIDERSKERENLPLLDGIARLRAVLGKPRQALRLIGLSGLGKTRLVRALFETGVGLAPLDAGMAIYTDYSEDTTPSAREMAQGLIESNRRAILIIDNCNPQTHAELARICAGDRGNVSLLTVEYDVRDDEPERTEVFRLQNASPALVGEWIKREFGHISQIDRSRIATFSDGNFRVARALADTLKKGETLGQLKNNELFQRIFWQRNAPDQSLQLAAEDLSLLYSFDGQDCGVDGELARIGALRDVVPRELFAAVVDLGRRGVVQARGRWRAILPQAIANPLAAHALQRIPDAEFDAFCASLPSRMVNSLSRRLGYLHDSPESQRVVKRWLKPDSPVGELLALGNFGLEIIRNVAPVAPEAVLAKITAELASPRGSLLIGADHRTRSQLTGLIKALAYEPATFEDAAMTLARFAGIEPEDRNDSARVPFCELFHLYLSGTRASPQQRRDLVRRLSRDPNPDVRRCAFLALDALLQSAHFSSSSHHNFGARPRNFGWAPSVASDIYDWFNEAIALTLELDGTVGDARSLLARNIRQLWNYSSCEDALERASELLSCDVPWVDGWLAFRSALHFGGVPMPAEKRRRLLAIINRLAPMDLLSQARAAVLTHQFGIYDTLGSDNEDSPSNAWEKVTHRATELGKVFAMDDTLLRAFLPDLFAEQSATSAGAFGKGLAFGADDIAYVWATLHDALTKMPEGKRNVTVLGGFFSGAVGREPKFLASVLDSIGNDPVLAHQLPWLQCQVGLDKPGIQRLVDAIDAGKIDAKHLRPLVSGIVRDAPAAQLAALLGKISAMPGGPTCALEILHMRLYGLFQDGRPVEPTLISCGRALLGIADFSKRSRVDDFGLKTIIKVCLSGRAGEADTRNLCCRVREALDDYRISAYDIGHLLEGLFETQPFIALDELVMMSTPSKRQEVFDVSLNRPTPIDVIASPTLQAWAHFDPGKRYPALGSALSLFIKNETGVEIGISSRFLEMLDYAPDRVAFLQGAREKIQPRSWSGPLHLTLERRREMLRVFLCHIDPMVRAWVADQESWLATWIVAEREKESERENSFE